MTSRPTDTSLASPAPPHLPTVASTHATGYVVVLVWCKARRRQKVADLEALIAVGEGDVPLINLCWRCGRCGSRLTDWVYTSRNAIAAKPSFAYLA